MHKCICYNTHTCMCVYVSLYISLSLSLYIYICIHICLSLSLYIYIYTYTYIHTYIYIYIYIHMHNQGDIRRGPHLGFPGVAGSDVLPDQLGAPSPKLKPEITILVLLLVVITTLIFTIHSINICGHYFHAAIVLDVRKCEIPASREDTAVLCGQLVFLFVSLVMAAFAVSLGCLLLWKCVVVDCVKRFSLVSSHSASRTSKC